VFLLSASVGARYIPNNRVGVIENCGPQSSVTDGRISRSTRAGYQVDLLRGGMHLVSGGAIPDSQDAAGHRAAGKDRLLYAATVNARASRRSAALPL